MIISLWTLSTNGYKRPWSEVLWILLCIQKLQAKIVPCGYQNLLFRLVSSQTRRWLIRLTLGYKCDPLQIMGSTVFLPVLKSLFLHGCEVLCNLFLTGCPILEELSLHCFNGVGGLGISHKTLKRLTVHKDKSLHYDHNQNLQQQYQTRLLNTPSLVYLDNSGHVPLFLPKTSNFLDSLVEARLNVRLPQAYNPSYDLVFIPIIDRVHNVKTLCISSTCVQAMNSLRTGVPWFLNLVKLSFESDTEQGWEALPHMLNKSPKLETLLLKGLYCVRKEGVVCADPKEVKVLEIYGFRGNCREFRQLKSFPCQVMKVEIIKADDSKKLQVISRLLDLSQRSSKCQIKLL